MTEDFTQQWAECETGKTIFFFGFCFQNIYLKLDLRWISTAGKIKCIAQKFYNTLLIN